MFKVKTVKMHQKEKKHINKYQLAGKNVSSASQIKKTLPKTINFKHNRQNIIKRSSLSNLYKT